MKIVLVIPHLRSGGPVDVEFNLCHQLLKKGAEVSVVTLRKETEKSSLEDFKNLGINVIQLELTYAWCELNTRAVRLEIQKIVDKESADIVHCHGYHPVLACSCLKGVRKVSTLHDRATEDFINVFGKYMGRYMLYRYFKALKRFDLNIGVSQSVADLYKRYIPNVCYVNNGIDTSRYYPVDDFHRLNIRKKLSLPAEGTIMISTGRIEKEKRFEELIDWFINNRGNWNVYLLILGDGSRYNSCQRIVGSNNRILLPGRVSNVEDYLKCSDIYISNSQSEGMSMAVCEGISCGLYPVLSDIPSHRDVAESIGGYLYDNLSDINLDVVLSSRIDKDLLYNYINDNFSVVSLGEGYLKCYEKVQEC